MDLVNKFLPVLKFTALFESRGLRDICAVDSEIKKSMKIYSI